MTRSLNHMETVSRAAVNGVTTASKSAVGGAASAATAICSIAVSAPPRPSETCTVQAFAPASVRVGVPVRSPLEATLSQAGPETFV